MINAPVASVTWHRRRGSSMEGWHMVKWITLFSLFTITNWLVALVWDASGLQWATNANIYGDWQGCSVAPDEFGFLACSACRHGLSTKSPFLGSTYAAASRWQFLNVSLSRLSGLVFLGWDLIRPEVAMSRGIQPTNALQGLFPACQWRTQWVGHIGLGLPKILSKFVFTTS